MALDGELNIALKEWAVVCRALEDGRQMLLLRKGGIYEAAGEFELEHRRFLLFPTYLHQNLNMLKTSEHAGFVPHSAEPEQVRLSAAAEVTDILRVSNRAMMDELDDQHVWAKPLIDMRFGYKPENPLYLLLLRVWLMTEPVMVQNTPAYAGCKSWVPLEKPVVLGQMKPALGDASFGQRRKMILDRIERHTC